MEAAKRITIDFLNKNNIPRIYAVQGDTARKVEFSMYSGGARWFLPNDSDVLVRYRKSDDTKGIYDTLPDGTRAWEINDNIVSISLAPQMFSAPGIVLTQITVLSQGKVLSTFAVTMQVEEDVAYGAVSSEDYTNIGEWILAQAVTEANRAKQEADRAESGASLAGGYAEESLQSAHQSEQYKAMAEDLFEAAKETLRDIQSISGDISRKAFESALIATSRMLITFELGSIYTHNGGDAEASNRIRTSYFPNLSGKIRVVVPTTVKTRMVFYNADLSFKRSENAFEVGSRQIETDADFVRILIGYADDAEVTDLGLLSSNVAVYEPKDYTEYGTPFDVVISRLEDGSYTADCDFAQIMTANNTNVCRCLFESKYLPLVYLDGTQVCFRGMLEDENVCITVTISVDGVAVDYEDIGGVATFDITITGNDADGYAADKTYEEIQEAWKQGQSCVCNCAGLLMPLVMLGGDAQFDTVWNGQEYRVYISPTGNVRVDISELGGGGSGGSGVYVGTEEPTDPNVYVWINPEGDADEPESGSEYALPVATSETLGGVMPVAKTEAMTQSVGVDALGRLWAVAGGGSGEGGGNVSFYEAELTMEQDVKKIRVELPSVAKNFFVWSLVSVLPDTGTEGDRILYVNIGGANINCSTSAQTVGSFVISAAKNGDCVSIGGRNRPDEQYNHAGSAFVSSGNNAFGGSTSLSSAKGAYIDLAAANDVMFPTGTWIKFWGMYSE